MSALTNDKQPGEELKKVAAAITKQQDIFVQTSEPGDAPQRLANKGTAEATAQAIQRLGRSGQTIQIRKKGGAS